MPSPAALRSSSYWSSVKRHDVGRTVDDLVLQPRRLAEHVIGVEARRHELGAIELGLADRRRRSSSAAICAARAICQPPATTPHSLRYGTRTREALCADRSSRSCRSTATTSPSVVDALVELGLDRGDVGIVAVERSAATSASRLIDRGRRSRPCRESACGRRGRAPECRSCLRRSTRSGRRDIAARCRSLRCSPCRRRPAPPSNTVRSRSRCTSP